MDSETRAIPTCSRETAQEPSNAAAGGWWERPCGGREVLAIALPLIVQTAFWSVLWFIDRMYLMWYSRDSAAAALPAGMFFWTLICFPQGIASFITTFVAQYHGAGRTRRIGAIVHHGIWFGWLTTPLFLIAIPLAPSILRGAGATEGIVHQEVLYFQTLALGAGALVVSAAMSSFFTGRGLTRVVMFVDIAGSIVNIVLDWVFIFGKLGCPEMGIAGAGLATSIANWSVVLIYWLLIRHRTDRDLYGFAGAMFDWELFRRLLRFGVPGALPLLIDAAGFTVLIQQVAAIGSAEAAATGLAFNVNAVAFVPLIGLGIAVTTLVGQKLGENRPQLAERATWTAIVLAVAYTAIFAVPLIIVPEWFLALHAAQADPAEFAPVRDLTIQLFKFVILYCFFDALHIVFVGALKGAGDTRFILVATFVISTVAVVVGRLSATNFDWQARGWALWGWWWVITGWIFMLGVTYFVRFQQGEWKTMRVIEPEVSGAD